MTRLSEREALSLLIEAIEEDHTVYASGAEAVARWKRLRAFAFNAVAAEERGRRRGVEERDELRAALSRLLEALCIADSDVRTREVRAAVANGQAALAPRDSAPVCDCEATLWGGGHIASCAAYPRGAPRDSGKFDAAAAEADTLLAKERK